jgi:KaiC/GvpD/RAD55 family RecA-like ATPase
VPRLQLIEDLTKASIPPGSNILVEFDPASQWYNASITIAAGWVKSGGAVSYNTFDQPPENVRSQLKRLGLDAEALEKEEKLRIMDWYTAQIGQKSKEKYAISSLRAADVSLLFGRQLVDAAGSPFPGTGWRLGPDVLRLADDNLVLLRFNDEKSFIDLWRKREIPSGPARNSTNLIGVVKGVYSEYIYKTMEASVDGIVDLKIEEEGGEVRNLIRLRSMRRVGYDSRWRRLKVADNFEVTLG